ncbi:hypothetical protein GY45DRAFT_363181 [Cubamyces sp. BRFM 1775]|nr:hypothetical protein GY45DRAFT_363181 [Cubamyces sp. BRFM 1775]
MMSMPSKLYWTAVDPPEWMEAKKLRRRQVVGTPRAVLHARRDVRYERCKTPRRASEDWFDSRICGRAIGDADATICMALSTPRTIVWHPLELTCPLRVHVDCRSRRCEHLGRKRARIFSRIVVVPDGPCQREPDDGVVEDRKWYCLSTSTLCNGAALEPERELRDADEGVFRKLLGASARTRACPSTDTGAARGTARDGVGSSSRTRA